MLIEGVKSKFKSIFILIVLVLISLLLIYLTVEYNTNKDYISDYSESVKSDYKVEFNKLINDIDSGMMTGIPSYDDAGVMYGSVIEITKGIGDFSKISPSRNTSSKTFTQYNNFKWNSTADQFIFGYSKKLHESSTVYANSGIVKLFDRYTWTAVGTYWADAFGLPRNTGNTYRVTMDTGISYDIISFDVKALKDTINTPNNKLSLGQSTAGNSNICLTEFDIIDYSKNYPTRKSDDKRPDMHYEKLLKHKTDSSHTALPLKMGDFNHIPEYKGNIVSVQLIEDPAVKEIFKQAEEEVKNYK